MMTNYDRLCDMTWVGSKMTFPPTSDKCKCGNGMREPGVEPGCPKAPDPKSDTPLSRPLNNAGAAPIASGADSQRHTTPPTAEQTTTDCATWRAPSNCQQEPHYPDHDTVAMSLRYPMMTAHYPTSRCAIQEPHQTAECGEFAQTETER